MKIDDYLIKEVQAILRREIQEAQGAEVFALGKLKDGLVASVKILGRGNFNAAPVVDKGIGAGMVVIHNHPSGDLHPSGADIRVASQLETRGTGFFIINNRADEIYVVIEAEAEALLDEGELLSFFLPDGPLASTFPRYEFREQQLEMVRSIIKSFNGEQHLLVEAATGTGKSWAYLLPALFWAHRGKGPVIISTNTINLQHQLLLKDIPSLKRLVPFSFKAVLMLGRGNYLCLRQLMYWQEHMMREGDDLEKMEISRLMSWSKETQKGIKSELNPPLEGDVWSKVSSEGDTCLGEHCQRHQQCFFQKNRREASTANLIIINHHLFFSDLSLRTSLEEERSLIIPEHQYTIFDEAHNLEDVATKHLGLHISQQLLVKVIETLQGKKKNGLIFLLRSRLHEIFSHLQIQMKVQKDLDKIYPLLLTLKEQAVAFFKKGEEFFLQEGGGKEALRIGPWVNAKEDWEKILEGWKHFKHNLQLLQENLYQVKGAIKKEGDLSPSMEDIVEIGSCQRKIEEFTSSLEIILSFKQRETVYWIEKRGDELYFMSAPLNVGNQLEEYLFNVKSSVILTSATLTVNQKFNYICSSLGLSSDSPKLCLSSPFHFQEQALLLVPKDLPLPTEKKFVTAATALMEPLLHLLEGRTLFLFTSYQMLNSFYFSIKPLLQKRGIITLSQGQLERREMVETFRSKKKAVILGTASFWEGVDIPGEDLSCVVIVKLPFPVPSDPIVEARSEMLREKGFNPFSSYFLPRAVIRFRQGFGRLIRSQRDRGVVLVLDKRIISKNYGQVFLSSLPKGTAIINGDSHQIQEEFLNFM